MSQFEAIFEAATSKRPYPFQRRFAESRDLQMLVDVPTGLGKTAMVVLGWLWRRRFADAPVIAATPRRLVYCLPMRVLVEQTRDVARQWLGKLKLADDIPVAVLMGGEEPNDWDLYPERDAVIIGTQDMLLSRALNRGYAMSRARWPLAFGLLNTDCLWVFDEIQLMGSGLATTAQLEAFRQILPRSDASREKGRDCRCVWMSATLQREWLNTVDFDPSPLPALRIEADDLANKDVSDRYEATKPLRKASATVSECDELAKQVVGEHSRFKGRTLVIVNTVRRARHLFEAIGNYAGRESSSSQRSPRLVLLHSRFRPPERARKVEELVAEPPTEGTICVSTQVVEAGVDVSATTLFTELAPWSSLIQRFGRCNRHGDDRSARAFWIDIDLSRDDKKAGDVARPYESDALREARGHLEKCRDVGSSRLPDVQLSFAHTHVIRSKDLIELFDTTPDLAGNDVDIDRYVRDTDDSDVPVFWRDLGGAPPGPDERLPARDELCPAPIGEFRQFVAKLSKAQHPRVKKVFRRNFLDRAWEAVDDRDIYPGQMYLLDATAGGYDPETGWTSEVAKKSFQKVALALPQQSPLDADDSNDADPWSQIGVWQNIAQHTDDVCSELDTILKALGVPEVETLQIAARWHDWGKVHPVFQAAVLDAHPTRGERPHQWVSNRLIAKAPPGWWKPRYARRHFRHELASALAVLQLDNGYLPNEFRDLVAYLVAAHHGKVRLSIRSLPGEMRPENSRRFARGVWEEDELPTVDLGGGAIAPRVVLSLEPMELGHSSDDRPSWAERMLHLRDKLGPFRLAYLEALLRAADMRASASASSKGSGS